MADLFDDTFIEPFSLNSPPARLINFATGVQVSEEVEFSLLNCHKDGETLLQQFVSDRSVIQNGQEKPVKSFHDPVQKIK